MAGMLPHTGPGRRFGDLNEPVRCGFCWVDFENDSPTVMHVACQNAWHVDCWNELRNTVRTTARNQRLIQSIMLRCPVCRRDIENMDPTQYEPLDPEVFYNTLIEENMDPLPHEPDDPEVFGFTLAEENALLDHQSEVLDLEVLESAVLDPVVFEFTRTKENGLLDHQSGVRLQNGNIAPDFRNYSNNADALLSDFTGQQLVGYSLHLCALYLRKWAFLHHVSDSAETSIPLSYIPVTSPTIDALPVHSDYKDKLHGFLSGVPQNAELRLWMFLHARSPSWSTGANSMVEDGPAIPTSAFESFHVPEVRHIHLQLRGPSGPVEFGKYFPDTSDRILIVQIHVYESLAETEDDLPMALKWHAWNTEQLWPDT